MRITPALIALCCASCDGDPGDSAPATTDDGLYSWSTQQPYQPPDDPLTDSDIVSCALYHQERCSEGARQVCALYEPATERWVDSPDPMLERALWYDRWYELYHSPDGQTADRYFTTGIEPGAPEEDWGDPDLFASFHGKGDSAIWTGMALHAHMFRYLETGTEADYQRFEDKVRVLLDLFEITGVPGYLARNHFLLMDDPDAPLSDQHMMERNPDELDHTDNPIGDPGRAELPDAYTGGIEDEDGLVWTGTPYWHGNPSIDQYTGPMTTLPAAHGLLRDEELRERIAEQLTCYLARLRRVRLFNLQDNPDAIEATQALLGGGALQLDVDDLDFSTLDELQGWVLVQPNSRNADSFDPSCPSSLPTEFWKEFDASDSDFLVDLVVFFATFASGDLELEEGVDHFYFPSVRGGDAMHLMHLAAMGWQLTGEEQYATLMDELQRDVQAVRVAHTAGAWANPKWCNGFYGTHITFTPWWAFLNLLEPSPLRSEMERALRVEMWEKMAADHGNAKFSLMYATVADPDQAADIDTAMEQGLELLEDLGGVGGVSLDPRRRYPMSYDETVAMLPEGIAPECPTEEQRSLCEDGMTVLGIAIPGESISGECSDTSDECGLTTGLCATAMADHALPVPLRDVQDFQWQRNPYKLGSTSSSQGTQQYPGIDYLEPYWLARYFGLITDGDGQVLAWKDDGDCDG